MRFCKIIMLVVILILTCSQISFAQENKDIIRVYLNQKQIKLNQNPIILNGTTLVPFRIILNEMGYSFIWNGNEKKINAKKYNSVELKIGSKIALINNKKIILSQSPIINNGVTYIPLRIIAEVSGAEVLWDNANKFITIKTNEKIDQIAKAIKEFSYSDVCYDFVMAITSSSGAKFNMVQIKEILFDKLKNKASVKFVLGFDIMNVEYSSDNTLEMGTEPHSILIEVNAAVEPDEMNMWYVMPDYEHYKIIEDPNRN